MVQINKPILGPVIPYATGRVGQCKLINNTNTIKERYLIDSDLFTNSTRYWRPKQKIYGHKTIKTLLRRDIQKNKCCYCEKEILSSYEVEHYRPCAAYQQDAHGEIFKPGYYWLSYTWNNLFYSCPSCNKNKGAFFPLQNNGNRDIPHTVNENCINEVPLLINLVHENPRDFIEYYKLEPRGTAANFDRGELMIETVGLRNEDMFDERKSHWDKVLAYKKTAERIINRLNGNDREEEIDEFNNYLNEKCNPEFPFSTLIANNRAVFELDL